MSTLATLDTAIVAIGERLDTRCVAWPHSYDTEPDRCGRCTGCNAAAALDAIRRVPAVLARHRAHLAAVFALDCTCPTAPGGATSDCDDGCDPTRCGCAPCIAEHALFLAGTHPAVDPDGGEAGRAGDDERILRTLLP